MRPVFAIIVLLFAAYIAVMNWGCVIVSLRNKKRGIDRHHSTAPLLSLFIAIVAAMISHWPWVFVVPLLDIANWILVWAPFGLMWEMCRRPKTP